MAYNTNFIRLIFRTWCFILISGWNDVGCMSRNSSTAEKMAQSINPRKSVAKIKAIVVVISIYFYRLKPMNLPFEAG
jgi:hypothetical protein